MNLLHVTAFAGLVCALTAQASTFTIAVNGNDVNDGVTAPVLTLGRAVALASEGDTIVFGDGEFEEPAVQVTIDKNLTITSANGPEHTIFRSLHTGVVGNVTDHSGWLYLTNCPNTVISGIYFCGKQQNGTQPRIRTAVYMTETAGTVSNCVFRYLRGGVGYGNNQTGMGPAAFVQGGTVLDCLFEENYTDRFYPKGGAIVVGGQNCKGTPLVDRCKFIRNWGAVVSGNNASMGGAMYISNGATVRNSLFYGNHSDNGMEGAIGFRYLEGNFKIINCTAVSNSCSAANRTSDRTWPEGYFLCDSIAWGNYSAGVVETTPDPGFVDAAGGEFHLAAGSTAIDQSSSTFVYSKKAYEIDPLRGDFDLDGKPRAMGSKADKGCYEFDPNQFSLGIDFRKLGTFAPMQVQFWAMATGGEMDDGQSYWTFDGTEPTAEHHDAAGTNVTVSLPPGHYDVRFVTTAGGETHSVEKAGMVSLVGDHLYVRKGNAAAAYPYDSWERAAAEFSDAVDILAANQTVVVDDGTYRVRNGIVIPAGVTIRSVNGPSTTILDATSSSCPVVSIGQAGCEFAGLTISNAWNTTSYTVAGITMTSNSTVTNCVFNSCLSLGSNSPALILSAGRAVDCVFTNCCMKTGAAGNAIGVTGSGLVDRSRVYSSYYYGNYTDQECGGAVNVVGGTVRNTLVTGTRNGGCPGIYVGANGKVENCTVVSNVSLKATAASFGCYVANATGSVTNTIVALNVDVNGNAANAGGKESSYGNCAVPGGFGANSVAADPSFKNTGKLDFHLNGDSPCVNAGTVLPWMAGGLDLDGRRRNCRGPDIGCFERLETGMTVIFR